MQHRISQGFENRTERQFRDFIFTKYGAQYANDIQGGVHSGNIDFMTQKWGATGVYVDAVYTVPKNHWVRGIIFAAILGLVSFGILFVVGIIWLFIWAKVVMANSAESEVKALYAEFEGQRPAASTAAPPAASKKAAAPPPPPPPGD